MGEGQIYAKVIVDIIHQDVDRSFDYLIPKRLINQVQVGSPVIVPFGQSSGKRKGYVISLSDVCGYDKTKLKEIISIQENEVGPEGRMVALAAWIKEQYGCTMIQALKTVLPVKKRVALKTVRYVKALKTKDELSLAREEAGKKHYRARERVFAALEEDAVIPFSILSKNISVSMATLKPMEKAGFIEITERRERKQRLYTRKEELKDIVLNDEQHFCVNEIKKGFRDRDMRPCLIHGVTASGKTEIYMELIDDILKKGKQAIVLIPEIALTYPTMMRFYRRFGDRIGFVHSRLSEGEKFEQMSLAKEGKIDIMIGPRSSLFTPFASLGIIVIDEEHDGAYNSDTTPRYHTIEVAEYLAKQTGAGLVLGSATPSMRSYTKALGGEYRLFKIKRRAKTDAELAHVSVVDMRKEMEAGNRSPLSGLLKNSLERVIEKKEQAMLFLNRRGYASFVSCRSCGHVMLCPHCDVSMSYHKNTGRLHCHYCGHEEKYPAVCPNCGSKYIAGFKGGTQKIEEFLKTKFPSARILRMDRDTTRGKDGYEKILGAFSAGEADILIGTQMIVKGHDFPRVTLMGVMAADLSLYAPDYTASERTFQLLVQAAGRAGRSEAPGEVIIQTYTPEHYSVQTAAAQDYESFYKSEIVYRQMLNYPPTMAMLTCVVSSKSYERAGNCANRLAELTRAAGDVQIFGPADDTVAKVKDYYRKVVYIKAKERTALIRIRSLWDKAAEREACFSGVRLQYDTE